MSDLCVIARRLPDGRVQYGAGGISGTFDRCGAILYCYYQEAAQVDYLFGLGQMRHIWVPGSENSTSWCRNECEHIPHDWGGSEQEIFNGAIFATAGYLWESTEGQWYHVEPGVPTIKMPLGELLDLHPDWTKRCDINAIKAQVRSRVVRTALERYDTDLEFRAYCGQKGFSSEEMARLREETEAQLATGRPWSFFPSDFLERFRQAMGHYDPWCLYRDGKVLLKRRETPRIETINW